MNNGASVSTAASRYALICQKCFTHNELVKKSQWEDTQYVCPKCGHFNPSAHSLRQARSRSVSPTRDSRGADTAPPASAAQRCGQCDSRPRVRRCPRRLRSRKKISRCPKKVRLWWRSIRRAPSGRYVASRVRPCCIVLSSCCSWLSFDSHERVIRRDRAMVAPGTSTSASQDLSGSDGRWRRSLHRGPILGTHMCADLSARCRPPIASTITLQLRVFC